MSLPFITSRVPETTHIWIKQECAARRTTIQRFIVTQLSAAQKSVALNQIIHAIATGSPVSEETIEALRQDIALAQQEYSA